MRLVLPLLLALASGCTASDTGRAEPCEAGASQACLCPGGGLEGTRLCGDDGRYGACVGCPVPECVVCTPFAPYWRPCEDDAADGGGATAASCCAAVNRTADCAACTRRFAGESCRECAPGFSGDDCEACTPNRAVDLLLVVDDSGSMCEEQRAFNEAFPALADTLVGAGFDYRVAVVSTDMHSPNEKVGRFLHTPAPPTPSLSCRDENGDAMAPHTEDCPEALAAILDSSEVGRDCPEGLDPAECVRADLALRVRCATTLGTSGDGFEKGLEAMRVGLSCDGPNAARFGACCGDGGYDPRCDAAPDFLRPGAGLLVVFLTDEDDCSDPATNPAASELVICRAGPLDEDEDGLPDGYAAEPGCAADPAACLLRECGPSTPRDCSAERCVVSRSENSNCAWEADRSLVPPERYATFLEGLKRWPDQIGVVAISGPRAYTELGHEMRYVAGEPVPECNPRDPRHDPDASRDMCCPEGLCPGVIQSACGGPLGQAFSGHRYLALTESLGERGAAVDICAPDMTDAIATVGEMLERLTRARCDGP